MHRFTPDGRTLLLLDAFGLTRVLLPDRAKTDRKIMSDENGALSVDEQGHRA